MRTPDLEWIVSDEQRAVLEPDIAFAMRLAPRWVDMVTVRWDPEEQNLCSVSSSVEYRSIAIKVGAGYFAQNATERRWAITHEFVHGHIEPLALLYESLVEATTEEEAPLRKWAKEQWRQTEEGCVCDFARRIVEGFS